LSMHLHAIIDPMFHEHHALVLSFNHLLIHLCHHITHHIHTCHIHPSTSGCCFNDCSSTISIPSTSTISIPSYPYPPPPVVGSMGAYPHSTYSYPPPLAYPYHPPQPTHSGGGDHSGGGENTSQTIQALRRKKRKEMSGPVGMRKFC
jgi:hypothetical protein